MSPKASAILDRVGVCASALCAVHCILTGLAMGFLAVAGLEFISEPIVEFAFVGTAFLVGGFAVFHGKRQHHSWLPASVFVAGLGSIVLSHFLGHGGHDGTRNLAGTILAVLGGLLIASFHIVNLKLQHKGCGCRLDRNLKTEQ